MFGNGLYTKHSLIERACHVGPILRRDLPVASAQEPATDGLISRFGLLSSPPPTPWHAPAPAAMDAPHDSRPTGQEFLVRVRAGSCERRGILSNTRGLRQARLGLDRVIEVPEAQFDHGWLLETESLRQGGVQVLEAVRSADAARRANLVRVASSHVVVGACSCRYR